MWLSNFFDLVIKYWIMYIYLCCIEHGVLVILVCICRNLPKLNFETIIFIIKVAININFILIECFNIFRLMIIMIAKMLLTEMMMKVLISTKKLTTYHYLKGKFLTVNYLFVRHVMNVLEQKLC
jgi:hypothetical protein